MSDGYDICFTACKPCEGCGQHIPKNRTPPLCMKCAPVVPPRPAAPDVDTDMGALREAFRAAIDSVRMLRGAYVCADAVLAAPEFRDLIAERDQAVAAVERVRGVLDALDETAGEVGVRRPVIDATVVSRELRRALDGSGRQ